MQYIPSIAPGAEFVFFRESSLPADLQAQVAALIAEQNLLTRDHVVSFDLAGGGDGGTFVARVGFQVAGTGLTNTEIKFYMASDSEALAIARAQAVLGITPNKTIRDEPVAGASQGTPFMGAIVCAT